MTQRATISLASDFEVVGFNPEAADLDRPRGEIVAEVFYLVATFADGERVSHGSYRSIEAAEAAIADAPPVQLWIAHPPEYGSAAYLAHGEDDQLHAEARCEEAAQWGFDTRFMKF